MVDICVVGSGYVGLTLGAVLADHFDVLLLDTDKEVIKSINKGKAHFHETGLDELIQKNLGRSLQADVLKDPLSAEHYIITVGTPLKEHIETDLSQVTNVIYNILDSVSKSI